MSLLNVKVFPGSRKKSIIRKEDGSLEIHIPAPPEKGRANKFAIDTAAEFLGVSPSRIRIVRGAREKKKIFSIDD
jgi:uncharacterized protein (TIGR00251 family)